MEDSERRIRMQVRNMILEGVERRIRMQVSRRVVG